MPPLRRVLGVDPGLAVTGYGIVDGDGVATTLITHGTVRTRARDARATRLASLFEGLEALIETHAPDDLAIEQHYVATNVRSAMVIGEARAVAMLAAARRGIDERARIHRECRSLDGPLEQQKALRPDAA
jgi:crossover junction endodeoxyribonuclease RuvC